METKDYLKYYWLEKYLEDEVRPAFHKHHFLTTEQFFSIVFWKSKRPARRIRNALTDSQIKELTKHLYDEKDAIQKVQMLLEVPGINIAMASAILTILYPDEFTIYDINVRNVLGYADISFLSNTQKIKKYLGEYIPLVQRSSNLSLRDGDRSLWAKSWYEDLQKFISVEKPVDT